MDVLDELVLGPEDHVSGLERRAGHLEQPAVVAETDDVDRGGDHLVDVDVHALGDLLGLLDGQVGLPLHVDDLAQHPAVVDWCLTWMYSIFSMSPMTRKWKVGRADVAVDDADAVEVAVLLVLDDVLGRRPHLGWRSSEGCTSGSASAGRRPRHPL